MAVRNNTRIDANNSPNCCLIITLVVFVSSCLVGAWMSMSSSNRMGISYEELMGGMPKVGGHDDLNPDKPGNEYVLKDESKSPDSNENLKIKPKNEKPAGIEKDLNDGKSGPKGSQEEVKPGGESKTKVEGSNQEKIPKEKEEINQIEKSSQEESISGSKERPHMSNRISHRWKTCNVSAGQDYIPCLDNVQAIKKLPSRGHFEHRERHCPDKAPTCVVRLPKGYRIPIKWPKSREMIWYANAPHTMLAEYKRQQNWVKVVGQYLTFPGGGTQFKHGALHYIDFIQKTVPDISWGKQSRVILDVGCGVASFGGYLFERDVLAMSLAPKDEHEAQVQFALERGIPAISAVMGTQRLPFPALVFDVVHCARCRVPWHKEGGKLLLELDRLLRPGGYFVWSATPVYRKNAQDVGIWKEMSKLTKSMCWELVQIGRDEVNGISAAIYRKPTSNDCYEGRQENDPPLCDDSDDPDAAWYTPLQSCIHKVPTDPSEHGAQWPPRWPSRLKKPPYWLKGSEVGAPNKPASKKFNEDSNYWNQVIANSYLNGIGIDWSSVRNVMDMRASYGGFAAAVKDLDVWVMNVVPVNSSDTLPLIYERGLFGIYHDWCESFNTYPRSYDLLHTNHLFSDLKKRCNLIAVMAEVDRILRPETWLIVRDDTETISEVESMAKSLQWRIKFSHYGDDNEGVLCVQKTMWRPSEVETIISAIG